MIDNDVVFLTLYHDMNIQFKKGVELSTSYTQQKYIGNTFVFAPNFHEMDLKI